MEERDHRADGAAVQQGGEWQPRLKISDNVAKVTNPGVKKIVRIFQKDKAAADLNNDASDQRRIDRQVQNDIRAERVRQHALEGRKITGRFWAGPILKSFGSIKSLLDP